MKKEDKETKGKSFWETLPGVLTGLAALVTAVIGLTTAILSLPRPNIFFSATSAPTSAAFVTPTGQPFLLRSSQLQNKANSGTNYYDFDAPAQSSSLTTAADFSFQPTNTKDSNTPITVSAYNGAKFGANSTNLFPWEIDPSQMTSAQGVYSVPQNAAIPCTTNEGKYCTFLLALSNNGDLTITIKLYELH